MLRANLREAVKLFFEVFEAADPSEVDRRLRACENNRRAVEAHGSTSMSGDSIGFLPLA
jgi:hypothetical protein